MSDTGFTKLDLFFFRKVSFTDSDKHHYPLCQGCGEKAHVLIKIFIIPHPPMLLTFGLVCAAFLACHAVCLDLGCPHTIFCTKFLLKIYVRSEGSGMKFGGRGALYHLFF